MAKSRAEWDKKKDREMALPVLGLVRADELFIARESTPRTGASTTGRSRLPLLCLTRLLIEATLLEILEKAGADELPTELLESPVQAVVFAERYFDHELITNPFD